MNPAMFWLYELMKRYTGRRSKLNQKMLPCTSFKPGDSKITVSDNCSADTMEILALKSIFISSGIKPIFFKKYGIENNNWDEAINGYLKSSKGTQNTILLEILRNLQSMNSTYQRIAAWVACFYTNALYFWGDSTKGPWQEDFNEPESRAGFVFRFIEFEMKAGGINGGEYVRGDKMFIRTL
jgi:hypothetical protein